MIRRLKRIKFIKSKNEDWVSKTLKKRQLKPILLTLLIIIIIFSYAGYNSYNVYKSKENVKINYENRIVKYNKLLVDIGNKIKKLEKEINNLKGLSVDSKKSINFLNKVCQLLKKRDVIGSFYIIKKQNKKYANVLDIEVQVSYGDKDLLFLVTKIVLEKVFYLKEIKQTKIGLKAQIFKPNTKR